MSKLDELFDGPDYDHPKLRAWAARLESGQRAVLSVRRPWEGITRRAPEIVVEFLADDNNPAAKDSTAWEDGLNSALLDKGVRAKSIWHESERLAISLQSAFDPLAQRYGDDYFNAVLIELMQEMGMTISEDVKDVLNDVSTHPASRSGAGFVDCRDDIKAAMSRALKTYVQRLDYSRAEATDILTASLATFIDERFSVSSRRRLGWARQAKHLWDQIRELAPSHPEATIPSWTISAQDLATYLRSVGFAATGAALERELLEHAASDADFPWVVAIDSGTGRLRFEAKRRARSAT